MQLPDVATADPDQAVAGAGRATLEGGRSAKVAEPHPAVVRVPPSFQAFRSAVAGQTPSLDPGRPGLRLLLVLAALAVGVAALIAWRSQPSPEPLPAPLPSPPALPAGPSPVAKVTVHLTGKVHSPGVYSLPTGSRVADAVEAAGGATRKAALGTVNLARRLMDGEQIVVGTPTGVMPGAPPPGPTSLIIDLNSATTEQLEELPGVGEVLAARIAEFRTAHGGFTSVDQLQQVTGIGPRKYEEIKGKARV